MTKNVRHSMQLLTTLQMFTGSYSWTDVPGPCIGKKLISNMVSNFNQYIDQAVGYTPTPFPEPKVTLTKNRVD